MRMLLKYCLLLTGIAGLVAAQHGGGGHSSGGGGHSSGGFHSSSPMSRPSGGYSGFSSPRVVAPPPIGLQPYASGFTGINRGAYNNSIHYGWPPNTSATRPIRRPARYGYYPYGFGYYPSLGYGYGDGFYDDSANYGSYAAMPDPNVETGPGSYYPPIPYDSNPQQLQPAPPADPPASPIVVILKNGQRLEVQSYAIMNGFFWNFSKQNSKRIPLANIDLAASVKATEDAGGSFPEEPFAANPR
jgi:hypothetical protein